jgi:sugar phosphate isomerase/epimerase
MYSKGAFLNILAPDDELVVGRAARLEKLEGLEHVEIWFEYMPNDELCNRLLKMTKGVELIVHAPFIHLSIASHVPEIVRATKSRWRKTAEVARRIGAKLMTVHTGSYASHGDVGEIEVAVATGLREFAEKQKIQVCLENMYRRTSGTSGELVDSLAALERICGYTDLPMTLDVGHAIQNGEAIDEFVGRLSRKIRNIHLHDGVPGGRAHMSLGSGALDLEGFLRVLRKSEYCGYVSLETVGESEPERSWARLLAAEGAVASRGVAG